MSTSLCLPSIFLPFLNNPYLQFLTYFNYRLVAPVSINLAETFLLSFYIYILHIFRTFWHPIKYHIILKIFFHMIKTEILAN